MGKPFLKWVGGKRQLIPQITPFIPPHFNRYFEPFMGGAALFFHLQPEKAFLSDVNEELVNCYCQVRDAPLEVIKHLQGHIYEKDYYYHLRNLDRDKLAYSRLSASMRAARLLYLNRTGFNGMYRVNSKGEFNVPFGRYKNPDFVNEAGILEASAILQEVTITNHSFSYIAEQAQKGDFVYFDPPYVPLSQTAHFTQYAKDDFTLSQQQELAQTCRRLHEKQVHFVASNSYHHIVKELYHGFECEAVSARRSINSNASGRAPVKELLIWNKL
ncbi:MAG: DNA adenine methylase [Candidatus Puniceispirillaceae bacterium]